jgi:glycosyltransferase involved in cell wall biosynthesis
MTRTTPLVTVGVPTYNGERFLGETLKSLLTQDLDDLEIVISDNGSSDGTERICRRAEGDPRVRYHRSPLNRGAAWNYNNVLSLAQGRYFKWAADDDLCQPTFLRRCVEALEREGPRTVVAWPQTILIDESGAEMGAMDDANLEVRSTDPVQRLSSVLQNRFEWHPVFGVVRTEVLRSTGGIGAFIYADVALLAELALLGMFRQVPEPLFLRRYHQGRSLMANPSFHAHAAWYDPANARQRAVFPNARLVRELLGRTARSPLTTGDHLRAAGVVIRDWAAPHWRHIGGEVKQALPVARSRRIRT